MTRITTHSPLVLLGAAVIFLTGCPPKYPKCDKDEDCQKEGRTEYCVNGMCQQCRNDADCPAGQRCNAGRCEAAEGYCQTAADCPNNLACKDNRCVPCAEDADCGPGATCKNGKCLQPGQCLTDEDCIGDEECQDGRCIAPPSASGASTDPCVALGLPAVEPLYFDFNEAVLTAEATRKIQQALECLRRLPNRRLRLEGHADPRGTEEYNLALGDRRARSVQTYLVRLGIPGNRLRPVSKGKLEATGVDESGWARDRKVLFIWE